MNTVKVQISYVFLSRLLNFGWYQKAKQDYLILGREIKGLFFFKVNWEVKKKEEKKSARKP